MEKPKDKDADGGYDLGKLILHDTTGHRRCEARKRGWTTIPSPSRRYRRSIPDTASSSEKKRSSQRPRSCRKHYRTTPSLDKTKRSTAVEQLRRLMEDKWTKFEYEQSPEAATEFFIQVDREWESSKATISDLYILYQAIFRCLSASVQAEFKAITDEQLKKMEYLYIKELFRDAYPDDFPEFEEMGGEIFQKVWRRHEGFREWRVDLQNFFIPVFQSILTKFRRQQLELHLLPAKTLAEKVTGPLLESFLSGGPESPTLILNKVMSSAYRALLTPLTDLERARRELLWYTIRSRNEFPQSLPRIVLGDGGE